MYTYRNYNNNLYKSIIIKVIKEILRVIQETVLTVIRRDKRNYRLLSRIVEVQQISRNSGLLLCH